MNPDSTRNNKIIGRESQMLIRLFDLWGLNSVQMLECLGLSTNSRTTLSNLRKGKPLKTTRDQFERIGILFSIHKNLSLLFSDKSNEERKYGWMTTPNKAFNALSPMDTIIKHGFTGLLMVRTYLDRKLNV